MITYELEWTCESTLFNVGSNFFPIWIFTMKFHINDEEYMNKTEQYEQRFEELLKPLCEKRNLWIYDVEYVKEGAEWCLRGYIDKEGGVTIDDCEEVSREISDILDQEDFVKDAYSLEISSPGLCRKLKKDRHFSQSIGAEVELKLFKPIEKQKDFEGTLKAFDKETITITTQNGEDMIFKRSELSFVRLKADFD